LRTGLRGSDAHQLILSIVLVSAALAWPSMTTAQGLFVVSQQNQKILHYDETDGSFIETFVEPITEGFQNPGGMEIHPSDGGLYVSSTGTGEIWKYTTSSGQVITPEVASGLISPGGIAFDAAGANLYLLAAETVLSTGTDTVMKMVVSSGAVSTIGTDGTANFSAVAVNGSDLYVSDTFNNQINRLPVSGGGGTAVITGLSLPAGILFRSSTEMLIADSGSDRVLEYVFTEGNWVFDRVVLPATAGVDGPFGLALAPDGRLTVSGQYSDHVVAVNLTTLEASTIVQAGAGGLKIARDVAWSGDTLLVSSLATNSILYYDDLGTPTGTVAKGISTPSDSGLTFSPDESLLAGAILDNDLVEYDGQTGAVLRKFFDACPTSFASPFDVAYGPDGNIYVACTASNGVFRFDASTGNPLGFFVIGGSGGLSNPRGLAFGPNGNLFVPSGGTGEILEYDGTTGAFVGVFVDVTGNGGGPLDPWGVTFHGGNLYVASKFPSEVKEFNGTTGAFVQTFVTSGAGGLSGPTAVAFGPEGDLYVTSFDNDSVLRYDGSTGAFIETFVASGSGDLNDPIDLAFRPSPSSQPPANVPALSPAGRALLLGLIFLLGVSRFRRDPRSRGSSRRSR
jgi:DNA-binding beta-propeller fold protein YncE